MIKKVIITCIKKQFLNKEDIINILSLNKKFKNLFSI